jgi:hypothetical protein
LALSLQSAQVKGPSKMTLRISILDEQDRVVFTVIGRIQAKQVSAERSLDLSNTSHEGGVTSYLEVITECCAF